MSTINIFKHLDKNNFDHEYLAIIKNSKVVTIEGNEGFINSQISLIEYSSLKYVHSIFEKIKTIIDQGYLKSEIEIAFRLELAGFYKSISIKYEVKTPHFVDVFDLITYDFDKYSRRSKDLNIILSNIDTYLNEIIQSCLDEKIKHLLKNPKEINEKGINLYGKLYANTPELINIYNLEKEKKEKEKAKSIELKNKNEQILLNWAKEYGSELLNLKIKYNQEFRFLLEKEYLEYKYTGFKLFEEPLENSNGGTLEQLQELEKYSKLYPDNNILLSYENDIFYVEMNVKEITIAHYLYKEIE